MSRPRYPLALVAVLAAAGCSFIPKYERPDAPVPQAFPSGAAYKPTTAPVDVAAAEMPWQQFITDAPLRQVIATALANNRDLRIAALNAERAAAMYGVRRAELWPTLDASAGMSRQRTPADLAGGDRAVTSSRYSVGALASWEVDFFGRIRSLSEAGRQEYLATAEAQRSAQISLISSVSNAYLNLAADRQILELSRTTFTAQQESLDLVQRRFNRGIATDLDLQRARQQVEAARVDIARYTRFVAQDINALNLLVGLPVEGDVLPAQLDDITPPAQISTDLSSDVLLQRPDVLAAEHRLMAANANIGAARAAFFPRIVLTGSGGTASADLSGLFGDGSGTWSFAPQIVMPIFDQRVWSAARVTKVDQQLALAQYERAIQASFREVADALAVHGTINEQIAAQEALVASVAEAYRLSSFRYEKGIDSYLSVLDAQRSLFASQQILVQLHLARLANQITLYTVLGGGWQSENVQAVAAE